MSNEHTVKSYEEELRYLIDSVIKMGSLTESIKCLNSSS